MPIRNISRNATQACDLCFYTVNISLLLPTSNFFFIGFLKFSWSSTKATFVLMLGYLIVFILFHFSKMFIFSYCTLILIFLQPLLHVPQIFSS